RILVQYGALGQGPLTNARPTLTGHGDWDTDPKIDYDNRDLVRVWGLLNEPVSSDKLPDVYQYDVVNVGRQVLGNYFSILRDRFTSAYNLHDLPSMRVDSFKMMQVIHDMDRL